MVTNYLFKNGYNNIGFIGAVNSRTTKYRFEGYCNVHKKHGVPTKNKYILGKGFSREDGFILAEKIINQYSSLSGLLVYNDVIASGVIDKFNIVGIEIPE